MVNRLKLRIPRRAYDAALAVLALVMLAASSVMTPADPAEASSHREAPMIARDPYADNTDTYAFVSPDRPDSVTIIGSWIPFEGPHGGPNYYGFADDVIFRHKTPVTRVE